jgi:hypothetical protein
LSGYVLTQGLASKVFVPPATVAQARDTVMIDGDGWFDIARTKALWTDVFKGAQSVIREGDWIDKPSASMPYLYVMTGAELADALRNTGRAAEAPPIVATTEQVANAAGFSSLVSSLRERQTPAQGDSPGVPLRVNQSAAPKTKSSDPRSGVPAKK